MKYNQKKRNESIEMLLFVMVLAVFAAVLGVMALGEKLQPVNEIREMATGWYYFENGKRTEITLPEVLKAKEGETLVLYNDSINRSDEGKVITTRGAEYDLKISLDGDVLYEYQDSAFKRNTQMKSKLECDGQIPSEVKNGTLTLTYFTPRQGKYKVSEVFIGSESAVTVCHIWGSAVIIGIASCFIVLSVISLLTFVYLRHRQMPDGRFRDVALFLVICGVWLITDSSVVQTYSSHPDLVCTISFYMFMMMAVPMLHFAQKIGKLKNQRILNLGIIMFYLNAFIQGLLNYFNIFDFVDMLFVTHILLWIWTLLSAYFLWREYKRNPEQEIRIVMIAYTVVSFSGILALLLYWMFRISYYGAIFEFGIVLFLILIIADTVISLAGKVRYRTEMQAYERLVREDWMTGMQSRDPFENMIAELPKTVTRYKNVLLILMDINHLRRINNDCGRVAGDEVVVAAARCIENTFGQIGKCYRIGGDEFAVVIYDPDTDRKALSDRLDKEIRNYNRNSRYRLSIARGFSSIRDEKGNLKTTGEWKYEADTDMYQNKAEEGRTHEL